MNRPSLPAVPAIAAATMVPWTLGIATLLPRTATAHHWNTVWAGLDVAIMAGLAAAVVSIGGAAANPFAQLRAPSGSAGTQCIGCDGQVPASRHDAAPSASGGAVQAVASTDGPRVRSVASGGRAAAPAVSAPSASAPASAAAPASGGLCGAIGRTGPPLLQTVLSPVAAVCDALL